MVLRSLAVIVVLAVAILVIAESKARYRLFKDTVAQQSVSLMAGYTEIIDDVPLDHLRGIRVPNSEVGLFKSNRDISFFWFLCLP